MPQELQKRLLAENQRKQRENAQSKQKQKEYDPQPEATNSPTSADSTVILSHKNTKNLHHCQTYAEIFLNFCISQSKEFLQKHALYLITYPPPPTNKKKIKKHYTREPLQALFSLLTIRRVFNYLNAFLGILCRLREIK